MPKIIGNQQRQRGMGSTGITVAQKMFLCLMKLQGYTTSDIRAAFQQKFNIHIRSSTVSTLTNCRNVDMYRQVMLARSISDTFQAMGINGPSSQSDD